MLFDHYKYYGEARDPGVLLEALVAAGREREAAEMAELERDANLQHKARMEGFCAWVRRQEHLTEAEQAEMIKASFNW